LNCKKKVQKKVQKKVVIPMPEAINGKNKTEMAQNGPQMAIMYKMVKIDQNGQNGLKLHFKID
jgi:hypothetical protein